MKRLMLSAMHSGAGKTVAVCGLLAALRRRGIDVRAFKSGPDYIDPMFHTRVLGIPSRNLDLFLQGEKGVLATLERNRGEVAVLEGAMGFYDGMAGTDRASAWELACVTDTPVILALRPKGTGITLAAQVRGLMEFRENSHISGLLLTDCKPSLADYLKPVLERETGLPVLGYLPPMAEAVLESRHLGLLTAGEIQDLSERFDRIAEQMEKSVDLPALLDLAAEDGKGAGNLAFPEPKCRIAVAMDEACCFYYADNFDYLRLAGAELVFFSPLRDAHLPEGTDGIYLGGGYPELYARQLSENRSMLDNLREAITGGTPTLAECGGFLLLQKTLEDDKRLAWPAVSVLSGAGFKTGRLQRFGYHDLCAENDSMLFRANERVPVHEFHYWDCTENGSDLLSVKQDGRQWRCGFVSDALYAAFPHLHFGGETPLAERFVRACIFTKKNR